VLRNALHSTNDQVLQAQGDQEVLRKGTWSISVSGNWRITFEFIDGNVYIVTYEDYH